MSCPNASLKGDAFVLKLRGLNELPGRILDIIRGPSQSAFLGYGLFNRHRGQGFGKEAVNAMIEIAFKDLNLHRIEAGIEPTSRRSILLARSLKLRKEGLKKRAVLLRGQWVDRDVSCDS